jgi:hypothetical protein
MDEKLNNVVYAVGVLLAIALLIFKNNMTIVVVILAIGLLAGGIIYLIMRKPVGYLMIGFGISVAIGLTLNKTGVLKINDAVSFVFALAIALSMILALVIEILRRKSIMTTHTLIVEAELIDLVRDTNVKKEMYMPVYSYKVDDEIYEVNYTRFLHKHLPTIGSTKPLRVNPKDHGDVYFDTELKDKVLFISCAVVFTIASIIVLLNILL